MRRIPGRRSRRRDGAAAAEPERDNRAGIGRGRRAGALDGIELFRGLTAGESRKVTGLMEGRRYLRGETIFRKDDPCDFLHVLKEGLVKLVTHSEKGVGTVLCLLRPPEVFGELLFAGETRLSDARALTDVATGVLSRDRLVEILSSVPRVRMNFIRILSRRLVRAGMGVTEFSHTDSLHRLARVLLRMCGEFGEETSGGVLLRVTLTHTDLAEMIGTSRETVANRMTRFSRLGLVCRRGGHLVVNRRRLADYVGHGDIRRDGERPALVESA